MPTKIGNGPSPNSVSTGLLTIVIFVVGVLVIGMYMALASYLNPQYKKNIYFKGMNYWHAMRCVPVEESSGTQIDAHISALERRLVASEAEVGVRI